MKSRQYESNGGNGTADGGTRKRQVHFWEDEDITEPLQRFCFGKKIGNRQLKPEDVYRDMARYLLVKKGYLVERKKKISQKCLLPILPES